MNEAAAQYRYVVVEGPIGAGKTSLARRLAEAWHGRAVLEQPDENPFLARFYQDPPRYALPAQLFFLFQRAEQLRDLAQPDLFQGVIVGDFLLDKDPLFARLNLSEAEYALYEKILAAVQPSAAVPDLVVYLQASVNTLLERVRRRAINYERGMSEGYLREVADAYSRYFHNYSAAPLLIVNAEHLNFVAGGDDFDLLLQRIEKKRSRREFFNRSG
jgi:deoxyadenosine/deoxycytidine kinase